LSSLWFPLCDQTFRLVANKVGVAKLYKFFHWLLKSNAPKQNAALYNYSCL
jgi:hypothetical protein